MGTSNTKGTMPVFAHPAGTRGPAETGSDTVNIPLERFNRPYDELSYEQGVKVHVSVERDVESN